MLQSGVPREDPVSVLERWRDHGAYYRILYLSDEKATVELLTCHGEPVERIESRDWRLLEYLRRTDETEA